LATALQPKRDVLRDRQMGKKRIILEYRADAARIRGKTGERATVQEYFPSRRIFEAGNQAQGGGFAASRRSHQPKKLPTLHCERNAVNRLVCWKMLGQSAELQDGFHVVKHHPNARGLRALKQFSGASDPTNNTRMRRLAKTLLTLCFPFLLASQTAGDQAPEMMTKMLVRLSGPGIQPKSHSALPRTIYRAGAHYARIEDPPDARARVQKVTIIAEPDAYSLNLIDKTGTHAIDQGGANDLHLPIVLPFDPKHQLPNVDRLEFGSEFEFFEQAGANKQGGPIVNANPTDAYVIQTAGGPATLVVKSGTETPIKLSWQTPDGTYTYEYISYEDVPFEKQLFTVPAHIKLKQIPPDNGADRG
jgi:hypothetical protein